MEHVFLHSLCSSGKDYVRLDSQSFSRLLPAQQKNGKKGFSRRLLFSRTTAATGVLALAAGGVAAVAATDHGNGSQALTTAPFTQVADAQAIPGGKLHEYWIQADSFTHNLVPTGIDGMSGMTYPANQSTYWAVGYRAYTANWQKVLPGDASTIGDNTGIPGPILRAEVGDTIRVHFRNNDTHYKFCHSMHPHGVVYTPANDGAWTAADNTKPGTSLKFGESYMYEWKAAASSVGSWPYHDHAMPATIAGSSSSSNDSDMNPSNGIMELGVELGLFGMIVVTDAQTTKVDREFILCFHDIYEADVPQLAQDFDCFNGHAFLGNTPTFEANVGERVRWRVMALGLDFHVFHLHGHRWSFNGRFDDALVLGPATTLTFDYVEDNPGSWLYHCHVTEHMMGGMVGRYITK
jgi:FtsP/CotA-like multicopper oxidase with cupredoxin domain